MTKEEFKKRMEKNKQDLYKMRVEEEEIPND